MLPGLEAIRKDVDLQNDSETAQILVNHFGYLAQSDCKRAMLQVRAYSREPIRAAGFQYSEPCAFFEIP